MPIKLVLLRIRLETLFVMMTQLFRLSKWADDVCAGNARTHNIDIARFIPVNSAMHIPWKDSNLRIKNLILCVTKTRPWEGSIHAGPYIKLDGCFRHKHCIRLMDIGGEYN